jgi:hypothetical protein
MLLLVLPGPVADEDIDLPVRDKEDDCVEDLEAADFLLLELRLGNTLPSSSP